MPLKLDIRKKLVAASERVKSVDIHPTEPWALAGLYSGNLIIWDYENSSTSTGAPGPVSAVKTFELSDLPVRCAKFVARKQWVIAASDDMRIRAYNYNTMEKVVDMEAHADYIRSLVVHPTLPYFLSSSDDMSVKLWDFEKSGGGLCENIQYYEGHSHYVMQVCWNPKDTNTFASASLDRSIKVWGINSATAHYTLEGHERGVNSVDYYPSGDKPYILSGADDHTVKIWDYQTKSVVHTLEGHLHNVCAVMFHPRLPLIASASEDGTVMLWQSTTYRRETTLNYGMERAWSLAATKEANKLAIGYDEGCIVIELGSDDPVASMDSTGKIVWCRNNEVQTATVKGLAGSNSEDFDGERLALVPRDLGNTEIYPQMLKHNCNGRFVAVCGDGEFIIYTAQALRNKAFGQALDFVWSGSGTGDYAIRESISRIQVFSNFKEGKLIRPAVASAEGLYGGQLLGVRGGDAAVLFYDWDTGIFVRKIDVCPKDVYWSEAGNLVLLACQDSAYVLTYDAAKVAKALAMGQVSPEDGVDGSFELLYEINETITSGKWVGDCFLFCNATGKLNYSVGGQIQNLQHLETGSNGATKHSILGYLAKEDRVYLIDKALNVTSYKIMLAVLQYQTAVMRGDFDTANQLLPLIPESEYTGVAKFLESQDFKEEAMAVTTDPDHKFDLCLELNHIEAAHELLLATPDEDKDSTDTMTKWKRLSDAAMKESNFEVCEAASVASDDLSALLLLYSSIGNLQGMERLCDLAAKGSKTNVAFVANLLLGRVEVCYDLLVSTKRLPEAAFFARTYLPSKLPEVVALWKKDLAAVSDAAAKSLADVTANPSLFPDYGIALQVEKMFLMQRDAAAKTGIPASDYPTAKHDLDLNLISLIKERQGISSPAPVPISAPPVEETKSQPKSEVEAPVPPPVPPTPKPEPVPPAPKAVTPPVVIAPVEEAKASVDADDFGDDW